ncbi:cathelicidin-related peptide Oh-Cath-like [Pituophis catenifer annectens]|uniref:cathelicidin-related peptide Oh-Cath-like n=1 Tax=Pituophis catenifer annectens TaxID=94852 RepID=UPI00399117B0
MEGFFWKTLMLVGILSASGSPHLPRNPLTYDEALHLGVEIYNKKAGEDSLYRLLEDVPQPEWDPYSESNQELNFTIKQTVCPVEEEFSMEECDFKENGLVRQCTGYYFLEERPPVAVLTCDAVEGSAKEEEKEEEKKKEEKEKKKDSCWDRPKRVKRFKNFFKKIRDGIHDFFQNNRFVIGVNFRF